MKAVKFAGFATADAGDEHQATEESVSGGSVWVREKTNQFTTKILSLKHWNAIESYLNNCKTSTSRNIL